MSNSNEEQEGGRREAIRRTLARRAGDSPDVSAVVEATVGTWQQIAVRLTGLVGARGVEALFARALHMTSITYPWLELGRDEGSGADPSASITARLSGREPGAAAAAGHALLVTFVELLASLIGDPLAEGLLRPVWTPPSTTNEQERI